MCARCEDLEAEIADLRRQLGLRIHAGEIGALRQVYGLSPNEAWFALAVRNAKGRALGADFILAHMPTIKTPADAPGRYDGVLKVMACRIRSVLGHDALITLYGSGYAAGPALENQIAAALPDRPVNENLILQTPTSLTSARVSA